MYEENMATNTQTILVVEDEEAIRNMLQYSLVQEGFLCLEAKNVDEAREIISVDNPNLILLDWMLPGMSGIDYARRLRSNDETKDIPIIMLTAKGQEDEKVRWLETGADDYITKPFSTKELVARIKALLRRHGKMSSNIIEVAGLTLNPETYRISINQKDIEVSPTEFKLLHFFISHPERVYSRSSLLDHVWGQNKYVEERTVDVHIRRLRKTLAPFDFDKHIQTVRSIGYRFSIQ